MTQPSEPRNPFYLLLLLSGLLFVVTALAYAVLPVLEEKATAAGSPPPPDEFRALLRADGWLWLLVELGVMMVFGILSMSLDRLRTLQKERAARTMPPSETPHSPAPVDNHADPRRTDPDAARTDQPL
jgi:hypothetical protein